jgi:hypothetical protein
MVNPWKRNWIVSIGKHGYLVGGCPP